jgi:hypothetical protein
MRRTLISGGLLAITAAALADHGSHLGVAVPRAALLGVALGAVLGLVPMSRTDRLWGRAPAFVVGALFAWLGYALRAGVLPDIPMGRAVAAIIVVALVTAVAVVSRERLPLWAGLIGVGAVVGAYETAFNQAPTAFTSESTTTVTVVLLAAACGYLAATIAEYAAHAVGRSAPQRVDGPVDGPVDGGPDGLAEETPRHRAAGGPGPRDGIGADAPAAVGPSTGTLPSHVSTRPANPTPES